MENPFKELDELEQSIKAPPSVKMRVMGSYGFITNIARVVEFIFGSLTDVCSGMLRIFDETPPSSSTPPSVMGLGNFRGDLEDEIDDDFDEDWESDEDDDFDEDWESDEDDDFDED